jgi:hypothetical protein
MASSIRAILALRYERKLFLFELYWAQGPRIRSTLLPVPTVKGATGVGCYQFWSLTFIMLLVCAVVTAIIPTVTSSMPEKGEFAIVEKYGDCANVVRRFLCGAKCAMLRWFTFVQGHRPYYNICETSGLLL